MDKNTVEFLGETCVVKLDQYANKRTAVALYTEDGEPMVRATVNLPEVELNNDEVIIKDWSENTGVYKSLLRAGWIGPIIGLAPTGYANGFICKLLKGGE